MTQVISSLSKVIFISIKKMSIYLYIYIYVRKIMDYFLKDAQKTGHASQPEEGSQSPDPSCFLLQGLPITKMALLLLLLWEEGEEGS